MKFQHVIFDCDGVLVDSEPLSMQVDWEMLGEQGLSLTKEEIAARFIGFTFGALIASIEAEFGIRLPPGFAKEKDRRLLQLYETSLQPVEGIHKLLKHLDFPKSVASNSPRSRVIAALRIAGLEAHFGNRIVTFEDVKNGKPAPDVYLEAARRAGVTPRNCLVIEDSVAGVTAAVAARCQVLGFTGTAHDAAAHREALRMAGAKRIFHRMAELPSLVGCSNPA
jgi:HAD superfamily hydrolase (TIGR01509 family)